MSARATAKSQPSGAWNDPITVLLADRDPLFLHGIESVLHDTALGGAWKVMGKVGTVRELIHHPRLPECSVLLSGLFLRCGRFLSVTIPDLLVNHPGLKVILFANDTEIGLIPEKQKKGLILISREIEPKKLSSTLRDALQGKHPANIDTLYPREDSATGSIIISLLSGREIEIFRLLGLGNTCREIASLLDISIKTGEAHRENIKLKLGLPSARRLCQMARARVIWDQTGADYLI